MKTLLTALIFAVTALAQPTITATAPVVRPGGTATVTVSMTGANSVALQFFISQIAGVSYAVAPGAIVTAGKNLDCGVSLTPSPALYGCVVSGGVAPLTDGVIAKITFPAPAVGTYPLPISLQLGASATADPVVISAGPPLNLIVTSACDINGDGKVDSIDSTLAIQGAISRVIAASLDLTGDGVVNVVDVQRVIAAANGGTCRVGL